MSSRGKKGAARGCEMEEAAEEEAGKCSYLRAGYIRKLKLINFMCHEHLEVDFW